MRKLRVRVWQVDDFNNESETAAVLEVSNPVPPTLSNLNM